MALSDIDRQLIDRCLTGKPQAWQDFVDRYMGLVIHVVNHTSVSRSMQLSPSDREDLISEVFLAFIADDFAVLRRFRGKSSLATYLTVVARRVVVHEILKSMSGAFQGEAPDAEQNGTVAPAETSDGGAEPVSTEPSPEERISNQEDVEQLLGRLHGTEEQQIVRLYHLEGKSYAEISEATGIPVNSIGPTLSRARLLMRGNQPTS